MISSFLVCSYSKVRMTSQPHDLMNDDYDLIVEQIKLALETDLITWQGHMQSMS